MTAIFRSLPTGAKLLLLLTLALLPLGLAMVWSASRGLDSARDAERGTASDNAELAARAVDSLIARNVLALRVAARAAEGSSRPCEAVERALSITPGVARSISFAGPGPGLLCGAEAMRLDAREMLKPGDIELKIIPDGVEIRVGVPGGMAIESLYREELRAAALGTGHRIDAMALSDGRTRLPLVVSSTPAALDHQIAHAIGNGRLSAEVATRLPAVALVDRIELLLPLLMFLVATLVSWWLVHSLLTGPLRRLETAVSQYEPGESAFDLPDQIGVAGEIRQLGLAFARTIERIDSAEQEMAKALDGQRRLVREVHHRVKNNLQVVASLLSIHSRTASTPEARAAYAGIMRRVDALSVVHRNHFAEAEENRGIALRPLLSELAAGLRAGAPEPARGLTIDLDLQHANTTQDVAVAVAFLVTEIVEFTMLRCPGEAVEISLRRAGELTSELAIASRCLIASDAEEQDAERKMFERIVDGLARQLRSPLDRRLGRYSVTFPIFPDA